MENLSLKQIHKQINYRETDDYVAKYSNDKHDRTPWFLHFIGLIEQPFRDLHTAQDDQNETNNYNHHIHTSNIVHRFRCIMVVHHVNHVHLVNHVCSVHVIHNDKMCCIHIHNLFVMSII